MNDLFETAQKALDGEGPSEAYDNYYAEVYWTDIVRGLLDTLREVAKLPEDWRAGADAADTAEWGEGMESCAYHLDEVLGRG